MFWFIVWVSSKVFTLLLCYTYSFLIIVIKMKANTDPVPCSIVNTSFILTHLRLTTTLGGMCYCYLHFTCQKNEAQISNFPKVTKHSSSRSCVLTTLLPDILKTRKGNKKFKNGRVQWLFHRTVTAYHSLTLVDTLVHLKVPQGIPIYYKTFLFSHYVSLFSKSNITHIDLAFNSNTSLESFLLYLSKTTHPKTRSMPSFATKPFQKNTKGWKSNSATNKCVSPTK